MTYFSRLRNLAEFKLREDMVEHFTRRTKKHIALVQKYLQKIIDLDLPQVVQSILETEKEDHDQGKWRDPEYEPYLHINWKYYQQGLGLTYDIPAKIQQGANGATFHHITSHVHHPEYWDKNVTIQCLNTENRDKPSGQIVDATEMPLSYIACMMADWLAMSEEKGTNVNDWIKMNVNVRWKFTPQQVALIMELASKIKVENNRH